MRAAESQRRLAQEFQWAQYDRHPGLILPPSSVPGPLKQIIDTRSDSSQGENRSQRRAAEPAAPAAASKLPEDKRPRYEGHGKLRGPYLNPDDAAGGPPQLMQLWRDVVRF